MSTPSSKAILNPVQEPAEAPVKMPVHLKTLFIGIRSRRRLLTAFAVVAILFGLAGAKLLGKKSFEARTVLLYRPPPTGSTLPAGEVDENDTPTLLTQMDLVKIDTNLEEVRRRLGLKDSVETLGTDIKVDVPINSSLMTITVTAKDAKEASEIANTTRQVFLEETLNIQHAQASSKARDLATRQDKVLKELQTAELNLKEFTIKNHVVDLDKEAGWYLQQLINTELVYEEAVGQNNASRLQEANIGKIASNLEKKVQAEEAQVNAITPETSTPANVTNSAIDESIRGRVADLKMKEIEMGRAKTLADDGIYSKREYEKAKAAYEQERFLLYKDSPSAALYKEMTLRELDVQLAHISDQQKVSHLSEAVQHVHQRLDSLPLVQRDYLALSREVAIRAAEREHIDQLLGLARREAESQTFSFSLVSEATPPILPFKSNGKIVFIAITILITICGLVVALALELVDRRIRSLGDACAKLSTEVLGAFNHGTLEPEALSDEALKLTHRLQHLGVRAASRLLVVSPSLGEGAPEIARMIARGFASAGDSVLLVDARLRDTVEQPSPEPDHTGWRKRISALLHNLKPELMFPPVRYSEPSLTSLSAAGSEQGLSDLLLMKHGNPRLIRPIAERIGLLPVGQTSRHELLISHSVGRVLAETASPNDVLLINTASMLTAPDATFLAPVIHQAVVVAAAGKITAEKIEGCCKELRESGVNVLGVVVTNIAEAFAERQAA